jgi:Ca2+:H+ antiporter
MLLLAAIGLISPAAFQAAAGATELALGKLSVAISVVLLLVYLLYLVFVLITHSALFSGPYHEEESETKASVGRAALVLAAATAAIAWISEIMVGAIEPTAHEFGLSNVFVGVFIVAILGNAAEHATAIAAAMKDRMDLSLSIAIASGSLRRADPGLRQPVPGPLAHGPRLPGRTRADGSSVSDYHRSGCRRRTVRLA